MKCEALWDVFRDEEITFFTGVPDSTFQGWMAFLAERCDQDLTNIIATNEGEAVAVAAGYHMATGKVGVVYLQNAGLGNTVNPLTSLVDREVYSIPLILMIGWRGEPGRKDEPQHIKMGRITTSLLEQLEIPWRELPSDIDSAAGVISELKALALKSSAPVALIVKKGMIDLWAGNNEIAPMCDMTREEALRVLLAEMPEDIVSVATTGKTARELFELREERQEGHEKDFLTVGSMGYASAIAFGLALGKPSSRFVVLDGDGALLMHPGSLATIGHYAPAGLYHLVLDNNAYDSTGGQRTLSGSIDFNALSKAFHYTGFATVSTVVELREKARLMFQGSGPFLLHIKVKPGARKDLGRPTTTPIENKNKFMHFIQNL